MLEGAPYLSGVTTFIEAGSSREDLSRFFGSVQQLAELHCSRCYEEGTPVWVAREPKQDLAAVWPSLRHLE